MTTYADPPTTVEAVLRPFSAEVRRLGKRVRKEIQASCPDAVENVYGGKVVANVLYSLANDNDVICGFQPQTGLLRVFFHHWDALKAAGYKVEGTGKNARHVKLKSENDFEQFNIGKMVRIVLDDRNKS